MSYFFLCYTLFGDYVMKLKRYYYQSELNINQIIALEGDEFHHLKNVMRTNIGDKVILFNNSTANLPNK